MDRKRSLAVALSKDDRQSILQLQTNEKDRLQGMFEHKAVPERDKSRVSQMDGNFFENFSALPQKQESLNFRTISAEAKVNIQSDEDLLAVNTDHPCKDLPKLTKKEATDLYRTVLSVIFLRLGSDDQVFPAEQELYGYLGQVFKTYISIEEHNRMILTVAKEAPPGRVLNVTVVEARDLTAKDANGLSDPYCVMDVLPHSESRKPLINQVSRGCLPSHKDKSHSPSRKNMQSTEVVKEQLNPKWNEHFRFILECDVTTGWFHVDVWDHDEETSVLELVKKSGDVQGIKGVRRLLKEVMQSTRLGGSNPDDFMGFVNIKLSTIPTWGFNGWFPLGNKSSRSTKLGEIYLNLKMSLLRANQSYQVLSPQAVHRVLWFYFVHHTVAHLDKLGAWDGELPPAAKTMLQQHAVQYEIADIHQSLSRWLAYCQECTICIIDFKSFYKYGVTLQKSWKPYALSADEEQYLQQSFHDFINYALDMLRRQQDMFPPTNKPAVRRLQHLLMCLAQINAMEFAQRSMLFQPNLKAVVLSAITEDVKTWYGNKYAEIVARSGDYQVVKTLASFTNVINTQVQRLLTFVHALFQSVLDLPYFTIIYRQIAQALMSDLAVCLPGLSKREMLDVEGEEYSQRSTALFELYLALRDFMGFSENLNDSDRADLEIRNYHEFFKRAVEKWLNVARVRAQERIKKAVELDQVALVDTIVKHSTSAVDVATCFAQIREFWKRLDWPDTVGSYVFVAKVTDDICHGAVNYANIIHDKLRQNGYYDDVGQFDITDQLCIAINNIEQVRRSLAVMPETLGWQAVQAAMVSEYGETAGLQCQDTLHTMMASADEDMVNVIEHVVQRVGGRMRPDFRRFLAGLMEANIHYDVADAIDPLMEYLDTNMITLHNFLLKTNFERILQDIWLVLLDELNLIVTDTNKALKGKLLLYNRFHQTLNILSDFFHADGKGIAMAKLKNEVFLKMQSFVESNMADTSELIGTFYCNKLQEIDTIIEGNNESMYGTLTAKCYYNDITHKLCVLLLNGRKIIAKDKSGTSDPYVILELKPAYVFPEGQSKKSRVVKETLNPLFDEKFEFSVTTEQCRHRGACLHVTIYDHDIITSDDLEGETFVALNEIPGIRKQFNGSFAALNAVQLPLILPEDNNNSPFLVSALKNRTSDKVAQEFSKKRQQILKRVDKRVT